MSMYISIHSKYFHKKQQPATFLIFNFRFKCVFVEKVVHLSIGKIWNVGVCCFQFLHNKVDK